MSTYHDLLGPDLEGLLREAAADPRSQLLRAPRPARVEDLFERQSVLRPSATGLTNLDRHLLAVHRAELAEVLLRACATLLYETPEVRWRIHRCGNATSEREIEPWDRLAGDVRSFPDELAAAPDRTSPRELVLALAGWRPGAPTPSLTQVAMAAHRIQPSSTAVAWVGFDQALHGDNGSALRVLDDLLHACPRLEVASASLGNRGRALSNLGRLDEAFRAYRSAFERDSGRTTTLVGWLHYAIQAGDVAEAKLARRTLDDVVRSPGPSFIALLDAYAHRKRVGELTVSPSSREIARSLASGAGSVSGKVIDVYV